jgi:hypothetical protein
MIEEFVDATAFLGMNSIDEDERLACVRFFAARLDGELGISAEQVGLCDDAIWRHGRAEQDAYYPFMDNLHSRLRFERPPYTEPDLAAAQRDGHPDLPMADRLALAMAANRGATLVTINPELLALAAAPVRHLALDARPEQQFPAWLEELYHASLMLRVPSAGPITAGVIA